MKKHLIVFVVLGLLFAGPAYADLFGFYSITNTIPDHAAIGETQLGVEVLQLNSTQVLFDFFNDGPFASSITQVYFDDIPLLGFAGSYINSTGVSFSMGAAPPNLPGGDNVSPPFLATTSFGANPSVQPNGVNPGESLGILFNFLFGETFDNVIADIASGDLRIGIHVQGFAPDGSESFVNNGRITNPIPEPATMLLLGSGLVGLALVGRRKFSERDKKAGKL